jgi:uroporphyrinogen-III synthase
MIRIEPPQDLRPIDDALRNFGQFNWLIFTSASAVSTIVDRMAALGMSIAQLEKSVRVAAVGKATGSAASAAGFSVVRVSRGQIAADLVEELAGELRGKRVFLPRSDRAAPALVTQLRAVGAEVNDATAYRTVAVEYTDRPLDGYSGDAILFFSPSAVSGFSNAEKLGIVSARKYAAFGAIGPVTSAALLENGLPCDFQARESSVQHIVAALIEHLEKNNNSSVTQGNSR